MRIKKSGRRKTAFVPRFDWRPSPTGKRRRLPAAMAKSLIPAAVGTRECPEWVGSIEIDGSA